MIEIKNVDFKYKNSTNKILDNINLNINDGEFVALVGKNGSREIYFIKTNCWYNFAF